MVVTNPARVRDTFRGFSRQVAWAVLRLWDRMATTPIATLARESAGNHTARANAAVRTVEIRGILHAAVAHAALRRFCLGPIPQVVGAQLQMHFGPADLSRDRRSRSTCARKPFDC